MGSTNGGCLWLWAARTYSECSSSPTLSVLHQHSLQLLAQPFRKRWKSLRRRSRVGGSGRPAVCTPSCCFCSSLKISKTNYLVCRWKPKPMLQLVPRSLWSTIASASFVTSVQSLMFFLPLDGESVTERQ